MSENPKRGERLVKSRQRVADHGEVFTPRWLVDGVLWQVECVRKVVPDAPVRGILCFVDSDWRPLASAFRVTGVEVLWPKKLAMRLRGVSFNQVNVVAVAKLLTQQFHAA